MQTACVNGRIVDYASVEREFVMIAEEKLIDRCRLITFENSGVLRSQYLGMQEATRTRALQGEAPTAHRALHFFE